MQKNLIVKLFCPPPPYIGRHLPPGDQGLHDPGRGLCQQRRDRGDLHLRRGRLRGRELQAEARRPGAALHGKLGEGHERLPGSFVSVQKKIFSAKCNINTKPVTPLHDSAVFCACLQATRRRNCFSSAYDLQNLGSSACHATWLLYDLRRQTLM